MTSLLNNTANALLGALNGHQPQKVETSEAKPAAVLMPFWEQDGQVQMVFTKRSSDLPHHAGQISFPGGMRDPEDAGLEATALRETHEEIGVEPSLVEMVTRLDQVLTVTNFLVTPFVGLLSPRASFRLSPEEVQRLIMVPVDKALDIGNYRMTDVEYKGAVFHQMALGHNGDVIWGATARILLNLVNILGEDGARAVGLAAKGK